MTPAAIAEEIRAARADFHNLVDEATPAELHQRSNGTRWTNDQLLFHMLFGYIIVRTLLWLVRGRSRAASTRSARAADPVGVRVVADSDVPQHSLELEISGRWPWQRCRRKQPTEGLPDMGMPVRAS